MNKNELHFFKNKQSKNKLNEYKYLKNNEWKKKYDDVVLHNTSSNYNKNSSKRKSTKRLEKVCIQIYIYIE